MTNLLASADPHILHRRIGEMIDAGRAGAARPLLAALRGMQGESLPVATLSARLLVREGDWLAAVAALDGAVGMAPDDGSLRKLRAEARMHAGDIAGAAADAADAVLFDRGDLDAKALLGVVLGVAGAIDDALACLMEVVEKRPGHAPYLMGLAKVREQAGDPEGAAMSLRAASRAAPRRADLRSALMLALLKARRLDDAVAAGRQAARAGAADAVGFGLLGHALSSLGRHEEAAEAYGEALKLAPEDVYVRHMVAASGAVAASGQAPEEYLRSVFDGYADRFEQHLISLGYRVPGLIRAELAAARAEGLPDGPMLDLGCGTGMVAVAVADLSIGPLTGVDISRRMLSLAAPKQLYARLEEAELVRFLAEDETAWQVVMAADVLCYSGDLQPALTAVARRLATGGVLLFSVEVLDGPGEAAWRLGRLGRYAHREAYVSDLLQEVGFRVEALRRERLRFEADAPVPGLLVRARR